MALLVRVDEIVCLQQDLVVDAADVRIGMVVRGQPRNAVSRHSGQAMSWITAASSSTSCVCLSSPSSSPMVFAMAQTLRKWLTSWRLPL